MFKDAQQNDERHFRNSKETCWFHDIVHTAVSDITLVG